MTCLVGLVDQGTVYLGGDSCSTCNQQQWTVAEPKVWKAGELVFGVSGSPIIGQLLRYRFTWPPIEPSGDPKRWLIVDVIPALRALLADAGQLGRETEGNPQGMDMLDANMVLGVRGRLFEIWASFMVAEMLEPYATCGSGGPVARGAMYATQHGGRWLPGDRVLIALEAAAAHTPGVRGPFTIVATE